MTSETVPDVLPGDPCVIVIFGASGDLTTRKLIPALYSLCCEQRLAADTHVIGVARSSLTDKAFQNQLLEGVTNHSQGPEAESRLPWGEFSPRVTYLSGGYDDPETYTRLKRRLEVLDKDQGTGCNRLFYLSTPPTLYSDIISQLGMSGLNTNETGWTRIIVEKPFGRDLQSSNKLDARIHEVFRERQVYRIDHYLGKETVQNLLTFRFANTIFELMWNRNYVDHVQISMTEEVQLEHRAGYYDTAGAVRDMFQNHMLQLLTLVGMEPPVAFNSKDLRDEKVKVLQAIRPPAIDDCVWGQYIGYRNEADVRDQSTTPTFLASKLYIDNWRWQGVPFYLRTGKALTRKTTEVTLQFKQVPHQLFQDSKNLTPNRLSIFIQPNEGMHLHLETKVPGAGMKTFPVNMEFDYDAGDLPDAYERLLLDAIYGDSSLFARSDEIQRAWEIVDPMLEEWESHRSPPLSFYYPGTWGPAEAASLMHRENREWLHHCEVQETE